jgi:hypothetical protein
MDQSRYHKTIKEIIARHQGMPEAKSIIRSKIVEAFGEDCYLKAVTSYLWEAYRKAEAEAKSAFLKLFQDDLRNGDPAAFYFFSLHYQHNLRRVAFDRRSGQDRRASYSVDFFDQRLTERRRGGERRRAPETRLNWTRIDEWVSVPFKSSPPCRAAAPQPPAGLPADRHSEFLFPQKPSGATPEKDELPYRFLNALLAMLASCFHNLNLAENTHGARALDQQIFQEATRVMIRLTEMLANKEQEK